MRPVCYVCEKKVIKPQGYSQSEIFILGDAPGTDEIKEGRPFVGPTGKVLRKELALLGLDLFQCRVGNLWYHKPNKNEECFKASVDVCLDEAKGKKAILLIGAETVEYFTGYKVSDVNGLQVESNMLSAPIIYPCIQPAIIFHGKGIGEVRFALTNFVSHLKDENII